MRNLSCKPVNGYLFITPDKKEEEQTIIVKKVKDDAYIRGKVISVGGSIWNDGREITSPCKAGDIVLYSFSGFEEVNIDGETIRILKFANIVGVFNE